jgi:PIN domain nuclease of toxin-antitoxin system
MKYLLDTHTFLWSIYNLKELPPKVIEELKDTNNDIYVSAVTLWEIAIKVKLKKLEMEGLQIEELCDLAEKMDFELISLTPEEAIGYKNLGEKTHKDPFDRMIIWQCISRNMTMISKDSEFKKFKTFGLKILWK